MIKNILVPTSGSGTDGSVFATARALAEPLGAHLEFYHVHFSPCEAAVRTPHMGFCIGAATTEALSYLERQERLLSANAARHIEEFCVANKLSICATPASDAVTETTCHLTEETDATEAHLVSCARHTNLIVLGRRHDSNLLPVNLIEILLLGSGRPIVIAPDEPPKSIRQTMVVGWQETPEAARSLGAAVPLLRHAREVVRVSVVPHRDMELQAPEALEQAKRQLAWHGINAEVCVKLGKSRTVAGHLLETVAEFEAAMLVVGAFQHGPLREAAFGGVSQSLIDRAPCPVFLMH